MLTGTAVGVKATPRLNLPPEMPRVETIVIVGGGFCGTLAAVNLARFAERPVRLCLVNHGRPLGRGAAYGTRRPEHLLNVVARNMSALPDHPTHFLDWLRTRADYADAPDPELRETFVPRQVYGDYLRGLLFAAQSPVGGRHPVRVETITDEVIDIEPRGDGGVVRLANGTPIEAEGVLLATGNQPPAAVPARALPSPLEGEGGGAAPPGEGNSSKNLPSPPAPLPQGERGEKPFLHPGYVDDPWADWANRLTNRRGEAILLGTGLTMVDAFLTLTAVGWEGTVTAVSRTGLLPHSHFKGIDYPDFPPPNVDSLGLAGLTALMEDHCQRLRKQGENPAIVVDRLRPHTQRIWQALSLDERRAFLRNDATRWNVHRHRIARQVHDRVSEAIAAGRLRIITGRVCSLSDAGERVRVAIDGASGQSSLDGDLVVNCTGPDASFSATQVPLFRNLLDRGLVRPDDLDMGIAVGPDFAAVGRDGRPSRFLYAIGPLLRGTLWETTAVPELRGQAAQVAEVLLGRGKGVRPSAVPVGADVLEYCI